MYLIVHRDFSIEENGKMGVRIAVLGFVNIEINGQQTLIPDLGKTRVVFPFISGS